jgi:Kef-type K+ transport system membrane component KefB
MRKSHTLLIYPLILTASIGVFLLIRSVGKSLVAPDAAVSLSPGHTAAPQIDTALPQVLLALVVIIIAARVLGWAFRRLNQPPVIGEMVAGILLGPSLLGHVAPGLSARLFPPAVMPFLWVISQIGVILYMFLVGVQLDMRLLRQRVGTAIAVSQAGIIAPFLFGAALALLLYPLLSSPVVPFTEFALFIGISMSVTAFPVLARILTDRQMHKSGIGTTALACAAAGDVTAWCLLAFVVSVARARAGQALFTVAFTAGFIAIIFLVVRPAIRWLVRRRHPETSPEGLFVMLCVTILFAALATERIGIHAIFGAFLLGVVVPHDSALAYDVRSKLEQATVLLILPAFFAFSGLRTEVGLVHGFQAWLICVLIIAVASAGKFGGSLLAARLTGSSWQEAASLGVLMNTRGLMELIVLNIGLDLGLISPTLFTMLVLMAVITTMATTPILQAMGGID